jgi:hypothetical protein
MLCPSACCGVPTFDRHLSPPWRAADEEACHTEHQRLEIGTCRLGTMFAVFVRCLVAHVDVKPVDELFIYIHMYIS